VFSYATGAAFGIAGAVAGAAAGLWVSRPRREVTLAAIVGGASVGFAAVFAVANLALQPTAVNRALVEQEVANGRLVLRLTSLIFMVRFFLDLRRIAAEGPLYEYLEGHPDLNVSAVDAEFSERGWRSERVLSRFTLLAGVYATLWALIIAGRTSLELSALSYLLAFVADDFLILAAPSSSMTSCRSAGHEW
jgi:hypothetical protein